MESCPPLQVWQLIWGISKLGIGTRLAALWAEGEFTVHTVHKSPAAAHASLISPPARHRKLGRSVSAAQGLRHQNANARARRVRPRSENNEWVSKV